MCSKFELKPWLNLSRRQPCLSMTTCLNRREPTGSKRIQSFIPDKDRTTQATPPIGMFPSPLGILKDSSLQNFGEIGQIFGLFGILNLKQRNDADDADGANKYIRCMQSTLF